jgi:hypothetical protein
VTVPGDDLTEAIAKLRSLTLVRQGIERGSQEYEAAVRREMEQIHVVRGLASSATDIDAVEGDV